MLAFLIASVFSAPNVILVSMDTLRAGNLGCYGYSSPTSPNIDTLAARSLVFDDAICEVPLTGPSFCAMMTSRFPRETGVVRNGIPLPEGVATVAEIFSDAGYETVCVTSNWTLKGKLSGLDRGFAVYRDAFHERRWGLVKSERDAADVTAIALDLLESRDAGRPLFAWFHYSDPHAPYKMRKGFEVTVASDVPKGRAGRVMKKYDSEIAYADALIGELLDALPQEDTYIVFVGDHGESLGEHGYRGHGRRLYQPGLRIPFMISGPGIEPGRSNAPARGLDVGTTLLGLGGLEAASGMRGLDLSGPGIALSRVRVVETYGGAVLNVPGAKELMTNLGPRLQGVLKDEWKLVLNGRRGELFNLATDPGEIENLAELRPERMEKLALIIRDWTLSVEEGIAAAAKLSEEDVEALESLGYID